MQETESFFQETVSEAKGDIFDIQFYYFYNNKDLRSQLEQKTLTIKEGAGASYRIINHWEEIGIIDKSRDNENGWRRFNIGDIVWQHIVMSLRNFGFPNEKIRKVKKHIFEGKTKAMLDYYTVIALNKKTVFVVVLDDGDADILDYREIKIVEGLGGLDKDHLRISLNEIVQKFTNVKISPSHSFDVLLNEKELDIIRTIRKGDYDAVTVKFKDGKIDRLEETKDINIEEKITDILRENEFQNIEIKRKNGNIVSVKSTVKRKL